MSIAKCRYGVWAALMIGVLVWAPWSSANNFKESSEKTGCKSILTRNELEACERVQGEKNATCNVRTDCDPDKQERAIKELETAIERFKTIPEADKENYKRSIIEMRQKIEERYNQSTAGVKVAENCIKARDAVQKWFEDVAIPLTERMKSGAVSARKTLVEKHEEAVKRREEAKKKLDEKPNDENRREWEAAREAVGVAQKKLEEFNTQYGPDIEYYADRLVRHYQSEKTNHDTPSKQAEARLNNCQKVNNMRYPSLPF